MCHGLLQRKFHIFFKYEKVAQNLAQLFELLRSSARTRCVPAFAQPSRSTHTPHIQTMAGVNLPTYMEEHEHQARADAGVPQPAAPAAPKYVDPIQLHPLLSMPIPKGVEYMSVEDPQASAGWGDSLMYLIFYYFYVTFVNLFH